MREAAALGADEVDGVEIVEESAFSMPEGAPYVPCEVLVTVAEGVDGAWLAADLKDCGAVTVDPDSALWIADDTAKLSVTQGFTVEDAVNELLLSGAVEAAQPDYVYYAEDEDALEFAGPADDEPAALELGETNTADALLAAQNDAVSDDPYSVFQWSLPSINAPQAWALAEASPLAKVSVAVIDRGFDVNHEDIRNVIAPGSPYNAYRATHGETDAAALAVVAPGIESGADGNYFDHGTHVAGIIAAERGNGAGIAGVAGNAQIVPIRAYIEIPDRNGNVGFSTSTLVSSFEYAIENRERYNIRVINLSGGTEREYGYTIPADDKTCAEIDKALREGIVTVCSAGNGADRDRYVNYPSDWATAVSVINLKNDTYQRSSVTTDGVPDYTGATWGDPTAVSRSRTSNYNARGESTKDISAPGADILSASDKTMTMILGKSVPYKFMSGTSMAAPHVSGVLAMMFGRAEVDVSYDGAQYMVDKLYESARHVREDVPFEQEFGFGEVDALAALESLDGPYVDGPSYVAVGQEGVAFSIGSKKADGAGASGWFLSSSDAGVLEVDAATGACTAKAAGTVVVTATRDARALRKSVTVAGPIEGPGVVMADKTGKYGVAQPASMSWEWSVGGDATITSSGVLTTGASAAKLTLTATLAVTKGSGHEVTLARDVWVLGALTGGTSVRAGETTALRLEVPEGFDVSGDALAWWSSDEGIATVSADGVVTGVRGGTATIWVAPKEAVSVDGSGKTTVADGRCRSATVTVTDSIARPDIEVAAIEDVTYTGAAQTPEPVLTLGGVTLAKDTDYTLSYKDNVDVGTATVTVTGVGGFAGTSREVTFKIVPAKISSADAEAVSAQPYTGKAAKPKPKLTFGGKELRLGTDYELSYKSNVEAGTATVVVTGRGDFEGTKSARFKITPAKISSATIVAIPTQAYSGKMIQPRPRLTFGGKTLKLGTDYELSYRDNFDAGTATVVVTGRGNFKGTKSVKFRIAAPIVSYRAYVQGSGWQSWEKNGATSGTTGQSKRMEAVRLKVAGSPVSGGITYSAHVQGTGWQGWRSDGAAAGLVSKGKRLEAIKIKLTGELAKRYDVCYRAHCQRLGWTAWAKNGTVAGTTGRSLRVEAIEIKIVPK